MIGQLQQQQRWARPARCEALARPQLRPVRLRAVAAEAAPSQSSSAERLPDQIAVVLGTQWGDEGKGKLVDILAQQYDIVARAQVSGGVQALP